MTEPTIIIGPDAPGQNVGANPYNLTTTATTASPNTSSYSSGYPSYADRIAVMRSILGQPNVKISSAHFTETLSILNSCIQHYHNWTDTYGIYNSSIGNTNPDGYGSGPYGSQQNATTGAMTTTKSTIFSANTIARAAQYNVISDAAKAYINHTHTATDRTQ